jgi:peptidoglycan L-alanyl-D-glutamate endopeptidase CwlK
VGYSLGPTSLSRLEGVHPTLAALVRRAIEVTTQDFTVMCGVRSLADEEAAVASGHSKTMHSKHLIQADGYGHAVDLVPWIGGNPVWDWDAIYPIASAMHQATSEQPALVRWGGVWDRLLLGLPPDPAGLRLAVQAYQDRHPGPDLLDGPHMEIA